VYGVGGVGVAPHVAPPLFSDGLICVKLNLLVIYDPSRSL